MKSWLALRFRLWAESLDPLPAPVVPVSAIALAAGQPKSAESPPGDWNVPVPIEQPAPVPPRRPRPYPKVVIELPLEGFLNWYAVGGSRADCERAAKWAAAAYDDLILAVLVARERDARAASE